jgi:hypothetical protein
MDIVTRPGYNQALNESGKPWALQAFLFLVAVQETVD